ncbi:NC domain protein [Calothrix sp. HK-06]|nr:NC domain protein [Calothrix sp. HK-06]
MAKGDHIYVDLNELPTAYHHGIDCGDGTVIHYQGKFNYKIINKVRKEEFAKGKKIYVKEYGKCDAPEIVISRAESRLYEKSYNLYDNNCEHFAHWCKTGEHRSEQVCVANARLGASTVGIGTRIATKVATKAVTYTAKKSLNPIAKTLVNVGLKKAPSGAGRIAGGVASIGGLVVGVATDMVVEKMYEDNEYLPQDERQARENARQAGQVGSLVGGFAGAAAAAMIGGSTAVAAAVAAPAVLGIVAALGAYHWLRED